MSDEEVRTRLFGHYRFDVINGSCLVDADWAELSRVFSTFYGKWSDHAPHAPGKQITLSPAKYRAWYADSAFKIARCFCDDQLVGQAIYLDLATSRGPVAFVVQLVVDAAHRHRGIATSILHAAFGFSDYYAWAIITSSPCTIASLENATLRRGNLSRIAADAAFIKDELFSRIGFLANRALDVTPDHCRVNTAFFTDRSQVQPNAENVSRRYGALPEGYEWLAIVFNDQMPDHLDDFARLVDRSAAFVSEAYRRMLQETQRWAAHAQDEIDAILRSLPSPLDADMPICDFGSGCGRHLTALGARGFSNVTGIDFALSPAARAAGVIQADCRTWHAEMPMQLIMCLYDVVGSFSNEDDNRKIIANIVANLASDGIAVISVANRDYAQSDGLREVDSSDKTEFLQQLFRMRPSNAMSSDGEFFHHPSLYDPSTGLYYHKEQFTNSEANLPAEYLIVDRRYTAEEISALLASAGLDVFKTRYVRAGFDKDCSRTDGKEILLFCRPSHLLPKGGTA